MGKHQYRPRLTKQEFELVMAIRNGAYDKEVEELRVEAARVAKQKQRAQDTNRIERKTFRDYARAENALIALNEKLIEKFDSVQFRGSVYKKENDETQYGMIVQVSDAHLNELVDLPHNKYDFDIASKRLKKYAEHVKKMIVAYGVNKILVALTGDLINSDRRLDEIMNMATSRAKAALIATELLKQFIEDLSDYAEIVVANVSGNESRFKDEIGFSDLIATDNYDFTIYNMLKLVFKGSDNVKFLDGNPKELVVSVKGVNFLLVHGEGIKQDTQAGIQQLVGKMNGKGYRIDYVLFGHIHFSNVTDIYARSASLVGSNGYSDRGLHLLTRAAQNMFIVDENRSIHAMKVDLQDTNGIDGYDLSEFIDAYDALEINKNGGVKDEVIRAI